MNGMCQTCGATAPIEWFLIEPIRRQFEVWLVGLPKPVEEQVFFYLSLFRPATGRNLTAKKALRVISEVSDLVGKGYVSVHGRIDRPCPPRIWAAAMEAMANQRHSLSLPMPNHKYLAKVAYDLADTADRQQEAVVRVAEVTGHRPPPARLGQEFKTVNTLQKAIDEYDAKQR